VTGPEGPGRGVDLARMRRERRERLLAAMAEDGVDAVLLGTAANIRYATGATPLWLAGTRPWAPLAVIRRDGETHVVANSDDGLPEGVGLVGPSWNPMTVVERLSPFLGGTVAVDGLTPLFEALLPEVVDATPTLQRCRATKTGDEVECLRAATSVCARAVAGADTPEQFLERMVGLGATIPAFHPRVDEDGFDVGAMVHGYEGGLARPRDPSQGARDAMARLLDACRPGARPDDLPGAYGIGLGVEPLATEVGSALCLHVDGIRDLVVLRPDGPELLSAGGP
jgi:Xaa-Pro dipeptidase